MQYTTVVMVTDNVIQWVFDKAFDQLTSNASQLETVPFSSIKARTFESVELVDQLQRLVKRPRSFISQHISSGRFIHRVLTDKLGSALKTAVLVGNTETISQLLDLGLVFDSNTVNLAVLNGRLDMIERFGLEVNNSHLALAALHKHRDLYFWLRSQGLHPNISVYNAAVQGGIIDIVLDVNEEIGLTPATITLAFEANNTDIISKTVEIAEQDNMGICSNLMAYPIINGNIDLVRTLDEKSLIKWHSELAYAAILSGSIAMLQYVEAKVPRLHDGHKLDSTRTGYRKGNASLLTDDITYEKDGLKLFSHCINYAVQSGNIEMVSYILDKGYEITASNLITAVQQGTTEMLEFLCENWSGFTLPYYVLSYFSIVSYAKDKIAKAKILYEYGLLDLDYNTRRSVDVYRKLTLHHTMITDKKEINDDQISDPDFLMVYLTFFEQENSSKVNHRLITTIRLELALSSSHEKLSTIFDRLNNPKDRLVAINTLVLFGTTEQVNKLWPAKYNIQPSTAVLMEILCYNQISKLCLLIKKSAIDNSKIEQLWTIAQMLGDSLQLQLFNKLGHNKPTLKYILLSGQCNRIEEYLSTIPKQKIQDLNIAVSVIVLCSVSIMKRFDFSPGIVPQMINRARLLGLDPILNYLFTIEQPDAQNSDPIQDTCVVDRD